MKKLLLLIAFATLIFADDFKLIIGSDKLLLKSLKKIETKELTLVYKDGEKEELIPLFENQVSDNVVANEQVFSAKKFINPTKSSKFILRGIEGKVDGVMINYVIYEK